LQQRSSEVKNTVEVACVSKGLERVEIGSVQYSRSRIVDRPKCGYRRGLVRHGKVPVVAMEVMCSSHLYLNSSCRRPRQIMRLAYDDNSTLEPVILGTVCICSPI